MSKAVYLDHAASAEIAPEVLRHMMSLYEKKLGNAASIHLSGVRAATELEKARAAIAKKCGATAEEVVFTSGATEANNLAILGFVRANVSPDRNEVLMSAIEHSSVLKLVPLLEKIGATVRSIAVDPQGYPDFSSLRGLLSSRTLLVSVGHANGEIGVVQDLAAISKVCKEHGAVFHSDGAQAFCKTEFDFESSGVDLYSLSGHKIHGPKGVGALLVRRGVVLEPLFGGGGQENGLRPGTVPVEFVGAFAKAAEVWTPEALSNLRELSEFLRSELKRLRADVRINGPQERGGLATISNFSFPGIAGKSLLQGLDRAGVRVSTGSACNSGNKTPSAVLKAVGLSDDEAHEAVRVSFGKETSKDDVAKLIRSLSSLLDGSRA